MKESRNFKTPKKPNLEETLNLPSPPNYESFEPGKDASSEEDTALILGHIDDDFEGLHETVYALYQRNRMLEELLHKGSENFGLRITEFEDELDTNSKHLEAKFDAPSLWSSIGDLVDIVSAIDCKNIK